MRNKGLARDYLIRARKRLAAVETLYDQQAWADVVRESQEIVELVLKALLRSMKIEVPRIHDVSDILLEHVDQAPAGLRSEINRMATISRNLRRDRELAFYGSEDLTPSEFYKKDDATLALKDVRWLLDTVEREL